MRPRWLEGVAARTCGCVGGLSAAFCSVLLSPVKGQVTRQSCWLTGPYWAQLLKVTPVQLLRSRSSERVVPRASSWRLRARSTAALSRHETSEAPRQETTLPAGCATHRFRLLLPRHSAKIALPRRDGRVIVPSHRPRAVAPRLAQLFVLLRERWWALCGSAPSSLPLLRSAGPRSRSSKSNASLCSCRAPRP